MANKEISLEIQEPAEEAKKADKPKKKTDDVHPPLLIEFTVTLSVIILVGVFFAVAGLSLVTGASLIAFILRTGTSILVIGVLLTLIVRQISSGIFSEDTTKKDEKPLDEIKMQNPPEVN